MLAAKSGEGKFWLRALMDMFQVEIQVWLEWLDIVRTVVRRTVVLVSEENVKSVWLSAFYRECLQAARFGNVVLYGARRKYTAN